MAGPDRVGVAYICRGIPDGSDNIAYFYDVTYGSISVETVRLRQRVVEALRNAKMMNLIIDI